MTFLLTRLPPSDSQASRFGHYDNAAQHTRFGPGGLSPQFDAESAVAGWTSDEQTYASTSPAIVVYGWPLAPYSDDSALWDGDSRSRPLSAQQVAGFVATNGFESIENLRGSFVVVAAYGPDSVDCYRSRAGGRTCYWGGGPGKWAISDSAADVAQTRDSLLRENPRWLARFFTLSTRFSAGLTPFEGVRELMPGEHLAISADRISTRRTPLALTLDDQPRQISDWVDAFGERLDRAVTDCLPAERPAAIMLSGGMDSGPAAVVAAQIAVEHAMPLHAVSWRIKGFPECNEWAWISMLAGHLGLDLIEIDAESHLPFSSLASDQVDSDSPIYNAFRLLILACYENARQLDCSVILNASSGDALYPPPGRALVDNIAHADAPSAIRQISAIFRHYGPLRLHRAAELRGLARVLVPRRLAKHSVPAWLTDSAKRHLQVTDPWPPECERTLHPDFGRQLFGPMASGGAAREVRFSQRYGIDRRDPYLDPDLRRLMLQVPHALIHRRGTTKWIAREAMRGRMPEAFRTKPRTGLLNAFFNHGFDRNREEIRAFLMDQRMLWAPWIKPDYLKATLEGKSSEERPRLVAGACIGYVLWKKRIGEE
ncbi:MAG TPA: asparagine synthase C-terminal domain-containing protein [Alphaproteobacteria bacterium]|nr:asparagine synthase C-terminal domain-containing protein [Alphaproteobacteria bacterium]